MNKEQIIQHYTAADAAYRRRLTESARAWLSDRGINIDRRSLAYWRRNEMTRSPLSEKYRCAYEAAILSAAEPAATN